MHLQQLCTAPHLTVSFDPVNHWLYIEWEGALTLPVVQYACLEIAHCFLTHTYARVLNSNTQVTQVDWDVAPWVAQNLLPALKLAGVTQIAWVYAPSVSGRDMAEASMQQQAHLNVALFDDVEDAVHWLAQTRPEPAAATGDELPDLAPLSPKLPRLVQALSAHVHGQESPTPA